jgi:peroxiredoxin
MNRKLIAAICFLWPCVLLAQTSSRKSTFVLAGKVERPLVSSKIYLLYQTEGKRVVDSSLIVDNNFHFKGIVPDPLFATLILDHDGNGLKSLSVKLVDEVDMLHFYLHPGNTSVKGVDSISSATFTLSTINKDYCRYRALLNVNEDHLAIKLSAKMQRERTAASENRYVKFDDSLKLARRPFLKQFAKANPSSYVALIALQEYAGAFPDADEIKPLFDALQPSIKSSKAGKEFNIVLMSKKELATGAMAPDFTQNDTLGRPVKLSSFRGKYVLIDFWASWCPSCRENNPELVKVYNELKYKNFTILGVSLDSHETKNAWIKAIKNDGLTWQQVSDLKHWDNWVVKKYGINAIPQNLLIDKAGRIMARNIGMDELKKKLEQAE